MRKKELGGVNRVQNRQFHMTTISQGHNHMGKDFVPPMSEYSSQFTVVESVSFNQGQFWNPQNKLIPKLTLVARFDQELAEILTFKEKVSFFELTKVFDSKMEAFHLTVNFSTNS